MDAALVKERQTILHIMNVSRLSNEVGRKRPGSECEGHQAAGSRQQADEPIRHAKRNHRRQSTASEPQEDLANSTNHVEILIPESPASEPSLGPAATLQAAAKFLAAHLKIPVATPHMLNALNTVLEKNAGIDREMERWLEEAQMWLACNQEQEIEVDNLRLAMAASLTEAEIRKAAEDSAKVKGLAALSRYSQSPLLEQVSSSVCPALLAVSGTWEPLLRLLDLEYKCSSKWYPSPKTRYFFRQMSTELEREIKHGLGSFSVLSSDLPTAHAIPGPAQAGPSNGEASTSSLGRRMLRCCPSLQACSRCGGGGSTPQQQGTEAPQEARATALAAGLSQPPASGTTPVSAAAGAARLEASPDGGQQHAATASTDCLPSSAMGAGLPADFSAALQVVTGLLQAKELLVKEGLAELNVLHSEAFVPSIFRLVPDDHLEQIDQESSVIEILD